MSRPEDELDDPVADVVRAALREGAIDPRFMRSLRAGVIAERERVIAVRSLGWRRFLPPVPPRVALAGAGALAAILAVAVIAFALVPALLPRPPAAVPVAVSSAVAGQTAVDPAGAVVVHFDRPMDRASVAEALRISPATAVTTAWRGGDLVVTPLFGLVPNASYVLTFERSRARTARGARPAADLRVTFGTSGAVAPAGAAAVPGALRLRPVAAAAGDSEAVIASDGSLIATAGRQFGIAGVLRILPDGGVLRLGADTSAICLSRNGQLLARLGGAGIVISAGDGSAPQTVPASVDDGSPLGWLEGSRVSFVSGGRLRAIDRQGAVTQLSDVPIDAAHDAVTIAPGGRYVYVRPPSGPGQLLDLTAATSHALRGIAGDPAFSADGGTVVWIDGSGPAPRLARAASAGGPIQLAPLPLAAGDRAGDLSVSPTGGRFLYTVTHQAGGAELRLGALASGATLASAPGAEGGSPNWSAAGDEAAVLTGGAQPELATLAVPAADPRDAALALGEAFANAQIDGDQGALASLAGAGVSTAGLPGAARASVVQVLRTPDGSAQVVLRLIVDATPAHPVPGSIAEILIAGADAGTGRLAVRSVTASPVADVTPGPQVTRVAATATAVAVTFDSDLTAGSVAAVGLHGAGGVALNAAATYDPASRTVTLAVPAGQPGPLVLTVGTGLRDVAGTHPPAPVEVPLSPGG